MIAKVCDRKSRWDSWFENCLVFICNKMWWWWLCSCYWYGLLLLLHFHIYRGHQPFSCSHYFVGTLILRDIHQTLRTRLGARCNTPRSSVVARQCRYHSNNKLNCHLLTSCWRPLLVQMPLFYTIIQSDLTYQHFLFFADWLHVWQRCLLCWHGVQKCQLLPCVFQQSHWSYVAMWGGPWQHVWTDWGQIYH